MLLADSVMTAVHLLTAFAEVSLVGVIVSTCCDRFFRK